MHTLKKLVQEVSDMRDIESKNFCRGITFKEFIKNEFDSDEIEELLWMKLRDDLNRQMQSL